MPSTRLCVFGCDTIGVSIHNFPNPAKFPERFRVWVDLVGEPLHGLTDDVIYKRKKVCDIHFTEADRNRNNRLNALAVPRLHIPNAPMPNPTVEILAAIQPQIATSSGSALSDSTAEPLPALQAHITSHPGLEDFINPSAGEQFGHQQVQQHIHSLLEPAISDTIATTAAPQSQLTSLRETATLPPEQSQVMTKPKKIHGDPEPSTSTCKKAVLAFGAEASGPSGVVRNSALSFVAQEMHTDAGASSDVRDQMTQAERLVPAGLKALCDACSRLYPDQPNPLQVTTRLKYWLGGHDPLDYISMYWNPGKPEENIPPHWHYVSFGLSDLHGDGRVHPPPDRVLITAGAAPPSGYGLELTLRLSAETPQQPPLWPAALLQALARYIFTTGNKFYAGDHISWHAALDGGGSGIKSRVRHLLVAEDPQLPTVDTPHGQVSFLQMVGCTSRELRAAQRGSGFDVLKLIAEDPRCGGEWLVTSMSRAAAARGLRGGARGAPACLAGVSARVRWTTWTPQPGTEEPASPSELSPTVEQLIKDTLQRGLSSMTERSGPEGHMSTDSFEMSSIERALPQIPELMQGSWRSEDSVEYLEGVHLMLNAEGASLLPLAIEILHDRHFTWREGGRAVTLVTSRVGGALPTADKPYASKGVWLQILIPKELAQDMSKQVANLSTLADTDSESDSDEEHIKSEPPSVPLTLSWPKYRFKISIMPDHEML